MKENQKYRMKVAYLGTHFAGWQIQTLQPEVETVQNAIENALAIIYKKQIRIHPAGRTDSGVHAVGQIAHFSVPSKLSEDALHNALNYYLPQGIEIRWVEKAPDNFHARYSALLRIYRYRMYISRYPNPFLEPFTTRFSKELNLSLLEKAIPHFQGTYDFRNFSVGEPLDKNTVRELYEIRFETFEDRIEIRVVANGFLRRMVRVLVGTLVAIAQAKISLETVIECLNRGKTLPPQVCTAPPQGLFFEYALYSEDFEGRENPSEIEIRDYLSKLPRDPFIPL